MKYIGKSQPIHDAYSKSTGYLKYTGDIDLPGMLYACYIHSTIPHGRVIAVHAEKALALDGVVQVFDPFNTTKRKYNRYRCNYAQDDLPNEERAFNDYVRFIGDRVGAVVATSMETARRAARMVVVEYEELPAALTFEEALAGKNCCGSEPAIKDEFHTIVGTAPDAAGLIEVCSFSEIPRLHHAAMETHACVVDYDPYEQRLSIYCPTQSVHGIRTVVADYLEMPESRVRVIKATMGGSFGGKQEWYIEPSAALMAKTLGHPVKVVFSREESMLCACVRAAMRAELRSLFTPDGTLVSMHIDLLLDAGAYIANSQDYVRALAGKPFRCYRIPHMDYRARIVSSNTPVSGAYRGWSAPESAIFMEHHMDHAAAVLGMDPIALRLKNVVRSGECDGKNGVPFENVQLYESLSRGRERFDWNRKRKEDEQFNRMQTRYRRGVGVGCGGHNNTYFPKFRDYAEARLTLNADGSVQALMTLHDHGCGTVTAMRMIIAEVLDVNEFDVTLHEGDTDYSPVDFGCFSSRSTFVLGKTAQDAANALKEMILDNAASLYKQTRCALYVRNGTVFSEENAAFSASYAEIAHQTMTVYRRNICVSVQFHNDTNPGVTGTHFAHVEVDTWTGFTRVLDYLAVQDIGQPINEGMCIAQIQGAVQMGCGAALREKLTIGKDGRGTSSLSKYHLFLAPDLPDADVLLITDGKSADGPFGAKSIGEICYVPVAATVCSAVNCAIGGGLDVLPFDPDTIVNFLAKERDAK